jgi:hypothetical protein
MVGHTWKGVERLRDLRYAAKWFNDDEFIAISAAIRLNPIS